MTERAHLRSLLGQSAELWAGKDGVKVEADRWSALSGANAVDYNVAVCHGPGSVAAGRDAVLAGGSPGLVMLAGRALAEAQVLAESRWVCVDAVPIMSMQLEDTGSREPASHGFEQRRLDAGDLAAAHAVIASSFGIPTELGAIALPERALADPAVAAWGSFDGAGTMLSTLILVRVERVVVPWSMATIEAARGTGRGSRLLAAALSQAAAGGAELALLQSSPTAIGFYRSCGFTELETWQIWSRPRWVLGRA
jgi:GNAT superfamily N-acetyltransferase